MKYLTNFKNKLNIHSFKNLNSLGAKRKIEKLVVEPSEHLINIAKNTDDVGILPDEYYPKWLHDYQERNLITHNDHFEFMACLGFGIPYNQDAINWVRLNKIVHNRHLRYNKFYMASKFHSKREKQRKNLYTKNNDELIVISMFEHGLRSLTAEEIMEGKDEFDLLEEVDYDNITYDDELLIK